MPEGSGTSSGAEEGGRSGRSGGNNNYDVRRPRNTVSGMEDLTLIKDSRTPALDLKKIKEAIQSKIKREEKDGYEAAALLGETAKSQPSSLPSLVKLSGQRRGLQNLLGQTQSQMTLISTGSSTQSCLRQLCYPSKRT